MKDADPDLIQRIRDVSSLAIGGPEGGRQLFASLDDPDSIVRYWATIGIGNLAADKLPEALDPDEVKSKLNALCHDKSHCVRIAAARGLLKLDDPLLAFRPSGKSSNATINGLVFELRSCWTNLEKWPDRWSLN